MSNKNPFSNSSRVTFSSPPNQSAGILDDYAVRKDVQTKEGTIEKTPIKNNDIVNKEYVDTSISTMSGATLNFLSGSYVPYTGATANVNLGSYDLTTTDLECKGNNISFNTNANANCLLNIYTNSGTTSLSDGFIEGFYEGVCYIWNYENTELTIGTYNSSKIVLSPSSDDIYQNLIKDKDILFKINDNGTTRTAIQVNGDEGSVSMPRQSYVRANLTNDQVIATGTNTTVIFGTETTDVLGEYNAATGIFTAKDAGVYAVSCTLSWKATNSGALYEVAIALNGTAVLDSPWQVTAAATYAPVHVSGMLNLAAGQTLSIISYQNSGGNESILAGIYSFITITKVS